MINLTELSKTLTMVLQASGLTEETPVHLHSVQESTKRFAAACAECGCEQASLESRLLEDSAREMNAAPLAHSVLKFFIQLESTMLQIENDVAVSASATAWWTGQRLAEVASAIEKFLDAEPDSRWKVLRETICHLGAMRSGMAELSRLLALPAGGEIGGFRPVVQPPGSGTE